MFSLRIKLNLDLRLL